MCGVGSCEVRLFEDEVGLGTDELRLAKNSMTATTTRGKVRVKIFASITFYSRQI
jgi:hypothetical protein